jgi:hypothetical protein
MVPGCVMQVALQVLFECLSRRSITIITSRIVGRLSLSLRKFDGGVEVWWGTRLALDNKSGTEYCRILNVPHGVGHSKSVPPFLSTIHHHEGGLSKNNIWSAKLHKSAHSHAPTYVNLCHPSNLTGYILDRYTAKASGIERSSLIILNLFILSHRTCRIEERESLSHPSPRTPRRAQDTHNLVTWGTVTLRQCVS